MAGFGLGLVVTAAGPGTVVWLRQSIRDVDRGRPDGSGLLMFGARPERVLVATLRRTPDLLWAAVEAARCPGLGAVLVELRDDGRHVDFTATRRLALAARTTGVAVVLARSASSPKPTAATTRWAVEPAPSTPLDAAAPGRPAFRVTLLRHRGGTPQGTLRVEWDHDQRRLVAAPLPGALVPFPADRSARATAQGGSGFRRRNAG